MWSRGRLRPQDWYGERRRGSAEESTQFNQMKILNMRSYVLRNRKAYMLYWFLFNFYGCIFFTLIYLCLPGVCALLMYAWLYVCMRVYVCECVRFIYFVIYYRLHFLNKFMSLCFDEEAIFLENIFLKMFYIMKQALVRGRVITSPRDVPHAHIMLFFVKTFSTWRQTSSVLKQNRYERLPAPGRTQCRLMYVNAIGCNWYPLRMNWNV